MSISATPIPTLTLDDLNELTSHITSGTGTDALTWGNAAGWSTTGTVVPGYGAAIGGGTGYTYTTTGTSTGSSPWIVGNGGTGATPAMTIQQGAAIDIQGENADIRMNGKSMKAWMEAVEERLNILTPNPELEKEWDDLRRLGQRYRALEKKCKEKAQMWAALKKVQPKQL